MSVLKGTVEHLAKLRPLQSMITEGLILDFAILVADFSGTVCKVRWGVNELLMMLGFR